MSTHESGESKNDAPTICPECGHDQSARSLPPPISLTHWSRRVPIVIVLIALLVFTTYLILTRASHAFSRGVTSLQLVEPGVTIDDLHAIADGPYPDRIPFDSLARSVERQLESQRMPTAGEARLEITFTEAGGDRIDFDYVGWPTPWYFTARYPVYDDAVRRTGWQRSRTDESLDALGPFEQPRDQLRIPPRPRWSWSWNGVAYQPPPEETDGVNTLTVIFPFALAVPLAAAFLLWWLVALAQACTTRLGWRNANRRRWPARFVAAIFIIGAFATVTLVERRSESVMNVRAGRIIQEPPGGPTTFMRFENAVMTTITESDLRTMLADRSTFDSVFAHRLIESIPADDVMTAPDRFLAIGLRSESVVIGGHATRFGEQFDLLERRTSLFVRRPEMGESTRIALPAGTTWELAAPHFVITQSSGDPNDPALQISIQLQQLALVVLSGSCLAWLAFAGTRFARRSLAKRRRAHHQCVACGHFLSAPQPR